MAKRSVILPTSKVVGEHGTTYQSMHDMGVSMSALVHFVLQLVVTSKPGTELDPGDMQQAILEFIMEDLKIELKQHHEDILDKLYLALWDLYRALLPVRQILLMEGENGSVVAAVSHSGWLGLDMVASIEAPQMGGYTINGRSPYH